jgi:hypothetical protein
MVYGQVYQVILQCLYSLFIQKGLYMSELPSANLSSQIDGSQESTTKSFNVFHKMICPHCKYICQSIWPNDLKLVSWSPRCLIKYIVSKVSSIILKPSSFTRSTTAETTQSKLYTSIRFMLEMLSRATLMFTGRNAWQQKHHIHIHSYSATLWIIPNTQEAHKISTQHCTIRIKLCMYKNTSTFWNTAHHPTKQFKPHKRNLVTKLERWVFVFIAHLETPQNSHSKDCKWR